MWQALTNAPRIVGKHIQELPLPPPRQGINPTQRLTRTRACAQELSELGLRVVAVMCGQALFDHVALIDTMLKQV